MTPKEQTDAISDLAFVQGILIGLPVAHQLGANKESCEDAARRVKRVLELLHKEPFNHQSK